MKLYALREKYEEIYNDSDYGDTKICDVVIDIAFSYRAETLQSMANELNKGHEYHWSLERQKYLRSLYKGYDDYRESEFVVDNISGFLID